jgi:DNA-binding FrmR family transcriptional regulator
MVTIKNNKQRILHRLKISAGQLKKVIDMVEKEEYCIDVLHNSLAIQKALKQIDILIMEDHLKTCAVDQIQKGKEEQMVKDLIGIYKYK